jgi:1-acyl-sn-glycerol-3-phosphate acyltransferase
MFITANTLLSRGQVIVMYAEGGRSRTGELGDVKPGIGRIALESGVPVVPVALHGSESVRRWKRFRFPKVTVQFGEPVSFPVEESPSRERQLEVATQIFAPVREMYAALATRNGRRASRKSSDRAPA